MKSVFKHIVFLMICIVATPIWAATEQARIEPLASKSVLLDVVNVFDEFLIAVGERGHILLSSNGVDWLQKPVPTRATLTKAFFIDNKTGWVVGHDATILVTYDAGQTWKIQMQQPDLQRPLFDVVFKDQQNGIAVGAYGYLFRTTDGGETWSKQFSDSLLHPDDKDYLNDLKADDEQAYLDEQTSILPHFNQILLVDDKLYLVGEIGLIAESSDFGKQWLKHSDIYHGSFFDITKTKQGNLLIAGLRGNIFRTSDQLKEWQKIDVETTALINNIVIGPDNTIYMFGNAGTVLKSTDNGRSFSIAVEPDGKALIAGTIFNQQLILASEVGIKTKQLK